MAADPRRTITPDAFTVAPELLGLPLASPRRRALAMLIDLALVGIMVSTISSVFLPLLAGVLFLRARPAATTRGRNALSRVMHLGGAILIFIFLLKVIDAVNDRLGDDDEQADVRNVNINVDGDTTSIDLGLADISAIPALAQFADADDEESARDGAEELAEWVRDRSNDPAERAGSARHVLNALRETPYADILREEIGPLAGDSVIVAPPDTAPVIAYAQALAAGDSLRADSLRETVVEHLAGSRIARLEADKDELTDERDEARAQLAEEEARGFRGMLAGLADDLGFGFGWMALYFTVFLVWWKGQTPGKRLLGLRVIRLDARPLSWWISFERFGGYAASFSIGLLGFLQILWDRNRQGLHDKAVETVVIRE